MLLEASTRVRFVRETLTPGGVGFGEKRPLKIGTETVGVADEAVGKLQWGFWMRFGMASEVSKSITPKLS
jgi:hypothetical protein